MLLRHQIRNAGIEASVAESAYYRSRAYTYASDESLGDVAKLEVPETQHELNGKVNDEAKRKEILTSIISSLLSSATVLEREAKAASVKYNDYLHGTKEAEIMDVKVNELIVQLEEATNVIRVPGSKAPLSKREEGLCKAFAGARTALILATSFLNQKEGWNGGHVKYHISHSKDEISVAQTVNDLPVHVPIGSDSR